MNEKPIGKFFELRGADLTGKVLAWKNNQPVFAALPDNPTSFVPVFDTPETLRTHMAERGVKDYTIKNIDNGLEFLESIEEGGAQIMLNPHMVEARPGGPR